MPSVSPSEALMSKPFKTQSVHSTSHIMMMVKIFNDTSKIIWIIITFDNFQSRMIITFDNFQSRTWGRRRLMFLEFSLTPQQASLRASTLGNHHHLQCYHHGHHHHHNHQWNQCYHSHHNDPFRYQMPANVKKRAITAGLIGEHIIFLETMKSMSRY